MKKTIYSFLIVVVISVIIKSSFLLGSNSSSNCLDFPNVCSNEQTCVVTNSTEYNCLRVDEIPIRYSLVASNIDDQNIKSYQYDISFINNSKNNLKHVRLSTDSNLILCVNADGNPALWNIDRFPNGDLIIKEDQIIYPGQTYNFGFILKNEISSNTLKLKSLEIIA